MLAPSLYRNTIKQKKQPHIQKPIAYMNIRVHARTAVGTTKSHKIGCHHLKTSKQCHHLGCVPQNRTTMSNLKKREHKITHNSSSRPPFDMKNSAFDRIFHAPFDGNSFKARKHWNKVSFSDLSSGPTKKNRALKRRLLGPTKKKCARKNCPKKNNLELTL